jgi:hypothetical protein
LTACTRDLPFPAWWPGISVRWLLALWRLSDSEIGTHVFFEKPVSLTVNELDAILDAPWNTIASAPWGFNRRFVTRLR